TFLVTGGGSGIGRLLSLRSADEGAHVVIWDLSASAGEAVRDEIRARRGHADSHEIDVTDRQAVKTTAEAVGPVDILVNNAGVVTGKRLLGAIMRVSSAAAMVEGRQQLVMPRMVGVIPAARLLPVKLFDRVMNLFGVNDTMDAFTGRRQEAVAPTAQMPVSRAAATAVQRGSTV
ncbi:MAG: SDR family NAD(P)-dependent oxidoreductase, partial [Brevibacterium yomogidense]